MLIMLSYVFWLWVRIQRVSIWIMEYTPVNLSVFITNKNKLFIDQNLATILPKNQLFLISCLQTLERTHLRKITTISS